MIRQIRLKIRWYSATFLMLWTWQCLFPTLSMALTSGPTLPEAYQFQMASSTEMVNVFDGSFSYNIPLFEVPGPNGGYPMNIAYQSGITMEQEATWVGLGWNLNVGAINRQMRGIPDDFSGQTIKRTLSMKRNTTLGINMGTQGEIAGLPINFGVANTYYYNTYNGFGMSRDFNVALTKSLKGKSIGSLGAGISFDSQSGTEGYISPSISLEGVPTSFSFSLNATFDSFEGVKSFGYTTKIQQATGYLTNIGLKQFGDVFSSNFNFIHKGYTPSMGMDTEVFSFSTINKLGFAAEFAFKCLVGGTQFNEQRFKGNREKYTVEIPAYGTLFQHKATHSNFSKDVLLDVNREKDGAIQDVTATLYTPHQMFDLYTVSGQGMSGLFRPMQSGISWMGDNRSRSKVLSSTHGVEVGLPMHVGANINVTVGSGASHFWSDPFRNFLDENARSGYAKMAAFGAPEIQDIAKANINNNLFYSYKPMKIDISANGLSRTPNSTNESASNIGDKLKVSAQEVNDHLKKLEGKPQTTIETFTNELIHFTSLPILAVGDSIESRLKRNQGNRKQQIGAYLVTKPTGMRYVYALPVYNKTNIEESFSQSTIDQTDDSNLNEGKKVVTGGKDKYHEIKEIPEYTYVHLLTCVLGPDYVDVDNNGPSENDLGYWVKFNYKYYQPNENAFYHWRLPYFGIQQSKGVVSNPLDDKGSYNYGEKEVYYLEGIETATHSAKLYTSDRKDAVGAASIHQVLSEGLTNNPEQHLQKLDSIALFSKTDTVQKCIQKVVFDYDYSLCKGVRNNINASGKLTLKEIFFEYEDNKRGALTPYLFEYSEENPNYNPHKNTDRWGNYRCDSVYNNPKFRDFPYTRQDKKTQLDKDASAWSLTKVTLPSGSEVQVAYECHDYAYVQDKPATEMVKIEGLSASPTISSSNIVYHNLDESLWLTVPILPSQTEKDILTVNNEGHLKLFFKINTKLEGDDYETIMGYAAVEELRIVNDSGESRKALIKLAKYNKHHPFAIAAWEFLRYNYADRIYEMQAGNPTKFFDGLQSGQVVESVEQLIRLFDVVEEVVGLMFGYFAWAKLRTIGDRIDLSNSYVKLQSFKSQENGLARKKYASGARVRQITMNDGWGTAKHQSYYGQVYFYDMKDEDGRICSAGVAAYEPLIGGEENTVRTLEHDGDYPFLNGSDFSREYPYNESLFPSAQIGYRQVTVMSLASALAYNYNNYNSKLVFDHQMVKPIKVEKDTTIVPNEVLKSTATSWGTTGVQVHEFYTAKDFPVVLAKTEKEHPRPYRRDITKFWELATENYDFGISSQGFMAMTNDMHGKPKRVSYYGQDKAGQLIEDKPIAATSYYYKTDSLYGKAIPESTVDIARIKESTTEPFKLALEPSNSDNTYRLGETVDLWVDTRHNYSKIESFIAEPNIYVTMALFGVPIPVGIPLVSRNNSYQDSRVMTMNKVIYKTGILEKVVSEKEGNTNTQENLFWHQDNGTVAVQKVTDHYGESIYSLNIPGYMVYPKMGKASASSGQILEKVSFMSLPEFKGNWYVIQDSTETIADKLIEGDELAIYSVNEGNKGDGKEQNTIIYHGKTTYEGVQCPMFYAAKPLEQFFYSGLVYRSGNRNQIQQSIGNINFKLADNDSTKLVATVDSLFHTVTASKNLLTPIVE